MKLSQKVKEQTHFWTPDKRSLEYSEPEERFNIKYKQTRNLDKRLAVQFEYSLFFRNEESGEDLMLILF